MLPIDTFTIVTGLASLLGLAIQIFDLFPRLGRARQVTFVLLLGIFIGSLLRAIEPSSIKFDFRVTGFTLLVALFALVIICLLVAAAICDEPKKRVELFSVSGIGLFAFMVLVLFGGMVTTVATGPIPEARQLTIYELNVLSDQAIQNKNYERAIVYLRLIESRLEQDAAGKEVLQDRIRAVELDATR